MKEIIKITAVLTTVCIVCAFFLSLVYGLANEKIAANAAAKVKNAITKIASSAVRVEEMPLKDETIHKLFDNKDKMIGYAFLAQGQGYQGKIKILTVTDPDLKILKGIEVVESMETPGLGAKIQEVFFRNQFVDLSISDFISCIKNEPTKNNQIKAITGATISSQAVVNILNTKLETLRQILNKK